MSTNKENNEIFYTQKIVGSATCSLNFALHLTSAVNMTEFLNGKAQRMKFFKC